MSTLNQKSSWRAAVLLAVGSFPFLLNCGGGGSSAGDALDCLSAEGTACANPSESEEIPDFFGELTVDVKATLSGTWNVQGYNIGGGQTDGDTPNYYDELNNTESSITFNADGTVSESQAAPLYSYYPITLPPSSDYCQEFNIPEELRGKTAYSLIEEAYISGLSNQPVFADPTLTYAVVETPFNPIVEFTLSGTRFNYCCVTGAAASSDCSSQTISTRAGTLTSAYLVIGARENEIALMDTRAVEFIVVLTRQE